MTESSKSPLTIYVPADLYNALEIKARAANMTVSQYASLIVETHAPSLFPAEDDAA